jgi:hypothetical protein
MKSIVLLFSAFILSVASFAQAPSNIPDAPRVFYDKGTLKIEPSGYKIDSYQVSLVRKHGDMLGPFFYGGGSPSKDILNMLQLAKPGDKLYFEEVKAEGPDHKVRGINSVVVKL